MKVVLTTDQLAKLEALSLLYGHTLPDLIEEAVTDLHAKYVPPAKRAAPSIT